MILRLAGPAFCVAVLWLLNPLPPPHAESASDPAAASASATDLRCACRDVIRFLHCRCGCPRGSRSRPPVVARNGRCCPGRTSVGRSMRPCPGIARPARPSSRIASTCSATSCSGWRRLVRSKDEARSLSSKPTMPKSRPGASPRSRRTIQAPIASVSEAQATAPPGPIASITGATAAAARLTSCGELACQSAVRRRRPPGSRTAIPPAARRPRAIPTASRGTRRGRNRPRAGGGPPSVTPARPSTSTHHVNDGSSQMRPNAANGRSWSRSHGGRGSSCRVSVRMNASTRLLATRSW